MKHSGIQSIISVAAAINISVAFLLSCSKEAPIQIDEKNALEVCGKLNENATAIQLLATAAGKGHKIKSCTYSPETQEYSISLDNNIDFSIYRTPSEFPAPQLSFAVEEGCYIWTLNGEAITDSDNSIVKVTDIARTPEFNCTNGRWTFRTGKEGAWKETGTAEQEEIDIVNNNDILLTVSSRKGWSITLPTTSGYDSIDSGKKLKGFYKDIFLDAGISLTSRTVLPSAEKLGYTLEYIAFNDETEADTQNSIIEGGTDDSNGRLLYPDGEPRYRLLFVVGGNSRNHGQSLTDRARENMKTFYENGGSYVGTCAGALFACRGYDSTVSYKYYLGLWPMHVLHTDLIKSSTGMFIENGSKLLDYYDFGGDNYIAEVRHNGGCYVQSLVPGAEVLARYDKPSSIAHKKPCVWAYSDGNGTGRMVLCGSHPEEVEEGERLDLACAMVQYAIAGNGEARIKGLLQNGIVRIMNSKTSDDNPSFSKIGDKQYHHFAAYIPDDAQNVHFTLKTADKGKLIMRACGKELAYEGKEDCRSDGSGAIQSIELPETASGLWYVSVECTSGVREKPGSTYISYSEGAGILNGVAYEISASWDCR